MSDTFFKRSLVLAIPFALGGAWLGGCGRATESVGGALDGGAGVEADGGSSEPLDAGGAPPCTPCVGTCIREIVRPSPAVDGRFAVLGSTLLRTGAAEMNEPGSSLQIWRGELSGGPSTDRLLRTEPAVFGLAASATGVLVTRENQSLLIDAVGRTVATELPVTGTSWVFATTDTTSFGLVKKKSANGWLDSDLYAWTHDGTPWRRIGSVGTQTDNRLSADETGAYFVDITRSRAYRANTTGDVRPLANQVSSYHFISGMVLGRSAVYTSESWQGRICIPPYDGKTIVKALPKSGGPVKTLYERPFSDDVPALTLVAGDDTSLVLMGETCSGHGGLWVMPSDGSRPPALLVDWGSPAPVPFESVQVVNDRVYFAQNGEIATACRTLE